LSQLVQLMQIIFETHLFVAGWPHKSNILKEHDPDMLLMALTVEIFLL
jgi:hypothetical protein